MPQRRISAPQHHNEGSHNHNLLLSCCFLLLASSEAFTTFSRPASFVSPSQQRLLSTTNSRPSTTNARQRLSMIYAPPGSGYASHEEEESSFPETYKPMMEYPGTMRPGRTPENMPFSDLPIGDDDPDPVPWPHFQQIEWHHKWAPPHPHPIPMEEFIELHGRWATPEMEAAMRAGVRRDIRERQEQEATERQDMIITDDDDDDDDVEATDEPQSLGDGMFGQLGSAADEAITAAAVAPKAEGEEDEEEEADEGSEEDDLDNFLLDLGLDADVDAMEDSGADDSTSSSPAVAAAEESPAEDDSPSIDVVSDGGDISATINVDDDDDLGLGLDEDDEIGGESADGVSTVPLDDFADTQDSLDSEDIFDGGGFDYDDGDFDGGDGDVW